MCVGIMFLPLSRGAALATHVVRRTTVWVLPLNLRQRSLRPTLRKLHSFTCSYLLQSLVMYNFLLFPRAQKSIIAAIDWHSFSQLILRPYGMCYLYHLHKLVHCLHRRLDKRFMSRRKAAEGNWRWDEQWYLFCEYICWNVWSCIIVLYFIGSWHEIYIANSRWSLHCFRWSLRLVMPSEL